MASSTRCGRCSAKVDANVADASGHTPLYAAAWNGHAEAVAALLQGKADPQRSANGYTPLHAAAWQGHTEVVRRLALAGASLNSQDADGSTPLHKAAWRGHLAVVQQLCELGADAALRDQDGFLPIDKARSAKREEIVLFLANAPRLAKQASSAAKPAAPVTRKTAGKP